MVEGQLLDQNGLLGPRGTVPFRKLEEADVSVHNQEKRTPDFIQSRVQPWKQGGTLHPN